MACGLKGSGADGLFDQLRRIQIGIAGILTVAMQVNFHR